MTGELGCTTPYIIVPGNWSRGDLEYHARGIPQSMRWILLNQPVIQDTCWPRILFGTSSKNEV